MLQRMAQHWPFFRTLLSAEWHRTREALQQITGQAELLTENPLLKRSIANRFPYMDSLNHLQVELLRRYREAQASGTGVDDGRRRRGIHITINGIAAGLRNSG